MLEAYYEPQFSGRSHGFRPGRGCHTALLEINRNWHGTTWFIEGDITDCFGSLDHQILLGILAEKIRDGRFLRLIGGLLQAGYLEDWRYHATLSGCPQGGIASPVLSNIYLDRLDRFIEQDILPAYNRGSTATGMRTVEIAPACGRFSVFPGVRHAQCRSVAVTLGDGSELHSGLTHCGRVNRFAATTAAATRTSGTPPACGLRDQPKAGRSGARVVHALRPQRLPLPRREATQAGRGATQGGGTCTLTCVP